MSLTIVTIERIPKITTTMASEILPQGHRRELKTSKYHKTNKGRQMKEKKITKIFNREWPGVLNMKVNNIKKSVISAIENITFWLMSVKNSNIKTIKKSEMTVINRKGDLITIITNLFQLQQFDFPVNSTGITCQFSICTQYPVARDYNCNWVVSYCSANRLGRHF